MGLHFDSIHQIFIIKMKLFILFGVLAMTLASSAQVQPGPPRDNDMQAPPLPTEDEHEREEDFEDFEDEEEMRDGDEGVPEFPEGVDEMRMEDLEYDRDVDEDGDEVPPPLKDL